MCSVLPVLCIVFSVTCPLYCVQCYLSFALCSLLPVLCIVYSVTCPLYCVHCYLSFILCSVLPVLCIVFIVICPLYCVQCYLSFALCSLLPVLCIVMSETRRYGANVNIAKCNFGKKSYLHDSTFFETWRKLYDYFICRKFWYGEMNNFYFHPIYISWIILFVFKMMQSKGKLMFAHSECSIYQDFPQYALIFMYISLDVS
jgi:hypothetical protein